MVDQLIDHPVDSLGAHCEPDTRLGAVYRGVDAHDFTLQVQQGAAAVAGVDCGVGLDQVAKLAVTQGNRPAQGADDTRGHSGSALKAHRVAYSNDGLSDPE